MLVFRRDKPWLASRPPDRLEAGQTELGRVASGDVEALVVATNECLDHLRPWMRWAQEPANQGTMARFVDQSSTHWERGLDFQYVMRQNGSASLVGGCGLHARSGPGVLEIGYWVHVDHVGRGIATAAARALTEAAFALAEVDRLEIRCDAANSRSASIPARLGYQLEAIERRPARTPGETDEEMVWTCARHTRPG